MLGLMRRPLLPLLHGLAARLLDGLLHHLGHHRAAVQLLDVGKRHLALAEALELDLVLDLVEARGEALAKLALAHDHLQLALEACGTRLGNLHRQPRSPGARHTPCRHVSGAHGRQDWCGRRDSNPHDLRRWNLNPVRLPVPPRPPTVAAPPAGRQRVGHPRRQRCGLGAHISARVRQINPDLCQRMALVRRERWPCTPKRPYLGCRTKLPWESARVTVVDGVAAAVGRTPLIKLRRASEETGCTILGKAEFMNPGQSVKDRAALFILQRCDRARHPEARRDRGGGYCRKHRHRPHRDRQRAGLPHRDRHPGDAEPGEEGRPAPAGSPARRGAGSALQEPQQLRALLGAPGRGAGQDRAQRRDLGQPVGQHRQPPRAHRDDGGGDLGRYGTARSTASSRRWGPAARWAACPTASRPSARTSRSRWPTCRAPRSTATTRRAC